MKERLFSGVTTCGSVWRKCRKAIIGVFPALAISVALDIETSSKIGDSKTAASRNRRVHSQSQAATATHPRLSLSAARPSDLVSKVETNGSFRSWFCPVTALSDTAIMERVQ